jgi:ABC-type multidrug transport system fused ATPase/permease subunit
LDPFGQYDDSTLWDALKRSYLVDQHKDDKNRRDSIELEESGGSGTHTPINRFTLDMAIEDEGGNLSVGQRSLVSLARALVKDSKVLVLDEATGTGIAIMI